ncbi:MAG: recombinase family protein [Eubacterium sp.]
MIEKENEYRAALYCRLSSDDAYLGESGSIQTQRALLTQYCKENSIPVYDVYVDDGFSGTNFERPDFKRMLDDLENHRANLVIVKDLSRFGREYAQMGMYIENDFEDWNIRFISIGENIDTLNGTDGILMPITNVINSQYAKECSRKTKQAHRALAKEGKFIGSRAPFGYIKDPNDRHHLVIDEEAAAVVQDIFRMFCDGIGYVRMTKILREQKVLNPQAYFNKNNPDYYKSDYWRQDFDWHATSIRAILNNPVYLGQTTFGRTKVKGRAKKKKIATDESEWIVVENTHEPLVDKETWDLVHDIMKNRRRETKRGEVQMFAGLVKCADCGSALNVSYNSKKQKFTSFSCWVYKNYGKERCSSHAIGYQTLYNIVLEDIRRQAECVADSKEKYIELLENRMDEKTEQDIKKTKSELRKVEKRLAQIEKVLNKLYEDRALEKITEERYLSMNNNYENEYNELKVKQSNLKEQITQTETAEYNAKIFTDLIEKYINITELNARILNELIDKIVVHEKEIINNEKYQTVEIYYKFVGLMI